MTVYRPFILVHLFEPQFGIGYLDIPDLSFAEAFEMMRFELQITLNLI